VIATALQQNLKGKHVHVVVFKYFIVPTMPPQVPPHACG